MAMVTVGQAHDILIVTVERVHLRGFKVHM